MRDTSENKKSGYTTADALLEALQETGVSYLFSNLGSDHPSMIEALAKDEDKELPSVIICPHESVALTAAHGYALQSGQAQAVVIHTDVGTANLGGSIHNAYRGRIPMFIFAGETPYTMEGEIPGSRNSFVNYMQNVYDQRAIVRNYVKWEQDIRTGKNVKSLVYRAMQMANSDPKGPVYLTGAREVMEEEVRPLPDACGTWQPIEKTALPQSGISEIAGALAEAQKPLLITSYIGKNKKAVAELVPFCEKLGIPVIEQVPAYMNFPGDHPLHLGFDPNPFVQEADVIIAIDTDVPWVISLVQPKNDCKVFFIDNDPIKEDIPLWHIPALKKYRADAHESLMQLTELINGLSINEDLIRERTRRITELHNGQRDSWRQRERPVGDTITPEWLTACIRDVVDDDTIILDETITNTLNVSQHLPRKKAGTYFNSGGTSLGWNGGAAVGVKLADPGKTVIALTGDGSYLFTVPSSVHWVSRRYRAPFLQVIYNNGGWNATKMNVLKRYPDGAAKQSDRYWVNLEQTADLAKIAEAAGGAYARTVTKPDELQEALRQAMNEVKNGRSAVIDVRLARISRQTDQ